MRKMIAAAAAFCLMATLLCGCRGNVSSREDGKITDPTGTAATMPGADTTPSYSTHPTETTGSHDSTNGTGEHSNDATGSMEGMDGMEGMEGNARSRRKMNTK